MAARAGVVGVTGVNHPEHWIGELASPELHAIGILVARDVAERERCKPEHDRYLTQVGGVDRLSGLDLEAVYPGEPREHFGYRDRLTHPVIEGTGEVSPPGSLPPIKAGQFFLGYLDESGSQQPMPQPAVVSRHRSELAYLRPQEHVGDIRDFRGEARQTREPQALV